MRKPDYIKMRVMLSTNENEETQDYILNKMSNDDVLYMFIRSFGEYKIPKRVV